MLKTLGSAVAVGLLTTTVAAAAPQGKHTPPVKHRRGCNTAKCDRHADAMFLRHLRRRLAKLRAKREAEGTTMVASYFGGGSGACGGGSWGVASKTLPCGTMLHICSASCAEVPVTDRGPFIPGRELDLTEDVARAIGFPMGAGVASVRVSFR